jgi:hypothetical protein
VSRARAGDAAIALVLGFNRTNVRPSFRHRPEKSYEDTATLVLRCVLSLRRVGTALPIHLLVSGERDARREGVIAAHDVRIEPVPPVRAPAWASPWMRGTFAKFAALSLTRFQRIILLDGDTMVTRNIDHLSLAPGPLSAYFHFDLGYTCPTPAPLGRAGAIAGYPPHGVRAPNSDRCSSGVLNSGVLVLSPDAKRLERAEALLKSADGSALHDGGTWEASDQRVWHALYERVHELPIAYNANADANLTSTSWAQVAVLHDIVVQRKRGWGRSGYTGLVEELTRKARVEMSLV